MLPFDQNKKHPTIIGGGSGDLTGHALERSMSKFMNAVQAGNVNDAVEAWKTLCALGSMED